MKAVAYSIKSFEKEPLIKANAKKHEITLISNRISLETISYAEGKDAVLVAGYDDVSAPVIYKLKEFGIKYIITRSVEIDHIHLEAAAIAGMKVAHVSGSSPDADPEASAILQQIAHETISSLDSYAAEKSTGTLYTGKRPDNPNIYIAI